MYMGTGRTRCKLLIRRSIGCHSSDIRSLSSLGLDPSGNQSTYCLRAGRWTLLTKDSGALPTQMQLGFLGTPEALELQGQGEDLGSLLAHLDLASVTAVLEVGCGSGSLT